MDAQQTFVTPEGLQQLKDELENLKNVKRKEVAMRIQEAKELGDLKENAEYSSAKDEQAFMENRVAEIEHTIRNAVVVTKVDNGIVQTGSQITVSMSGKDMIYTIVGSDEADPAKRKISNASPLGKAFMGKKVGDTVEVSVPSGNITCKILEVS